MGNVEYNDRLNSMNKKKGITQTKLAEKVGLTSQKMTFVMQGRWRLTDNEKKKVARVLKCKVEDIF